MTQPRPDAQAPGALDMLALAEQADPFIAVMGSVRAKFLAQGWDKTHAEQATLLLYQFALKATTDDAPPVTP